MMEFLGYFILSVAGLSIPIVFFMLWHNNRVYKIMLLYNNKIHETNRKLIDAYVRYPDDCISYDLKPDYNTVFFNLADHLCKICHVNAGQLLLKDNMVCQVKLR